MTSIFLSHNSKDKPKARELASALSKLGAKVWLDEAEMRVGDSLVEKIRHGIRDASFLGVVLSPNSVGSEWVKREVEIALNEEIDGRRVKVLPIIAKTCEVPGFLRGKVYADIRRKDGWEKAIRDIARAIGLSSSTDEAYQLVRIRRDIFVRVANAIVGKTPRWRLKWESNVTGICLSDYPEYNIQLYVERRTTLDSAGFEVLDDEWKQYESVISELDKALDSELGVRVQFPSGYSFKLDSVWAKSEAVSPAEIEPKCDVIFSYEGKSKGRP